MVADFHTSEPMATTTYGSVVRSPVHIVLNCQSVPCNPSASRTVTFSRPLGFGRASSKASPSEHLSSMGKRAGNTMILANCSRITFFMMSSRSSDDPNEWIMPFHFILISKGSLKNIEKPEKNGGRGNRPRKLMKNAAFKDRSWTPSVAAPRLIDMFVSPCHVALILRSIQFPNPPGADTSTDSHSIAFIPTSQGSTVMPCRNLGSFDLIIGIK
mmetsp:Transcript_35499/g.94048  ORF Transcript_35499/g.94048 Transcript_35499/m.94048 type:complete len:214 (+) Transcript_35499:606-1247(+)